jgi:hypothetical protein
MTGIKWIAALAGLLAVARPPVATTDDPEPVSMALLAIGLAALSGMSRARRPEGVPPA